MEDSRKSFTDRHGRGERVGRKHFCQDHFHLYPVPVDFLGLTFWTSLDGLGREPRFLLLHNLTTSAFTAHTKELGVCFEQAGRSKRLYKTSIGITSQRVFGRSKQEEEANQNMLQKCSQFKCVVTLVRAARGGLDWWPSSHPQSQRPTKIKSAILTSTFGWEWPCFSPLWMASWHGCNAGRWKDVEAGLLRSRKNFFSC